MSEQEIRIHAIQKRLAALERQNERQNELLFQTLELLRQKTQPKFSDWKDADDWIFSQLDFTKEELDQIYHGRNVLLYTASAKDGIPSRNPTDEPLKPEEIPQLSGQPIWMVPIGDEDWSSHWQICSKTDPFAAASSDTKRATMYFLYLKDDGVRWQAYLYPPLQSVPKEGLTEAVEACPYCEAENVYPNWDIKTQGYVAVCKECRRQIMLCDECLHADDNLMGRCDWRETETGGRCFRGSTKLI